MTVKSETTERKIIPSRQKNLKAKQLGGWLKNWGKEILVAQQPPT